MKNIIPKNPLKKLGWLILRTEINLTLLWFLQLHESQPRNPGVKSQPSCTQTREHPNFFDKVIAKCGNLEDLLTPRKPTFCVVAKDRFVTNSEYRKKAMSKLEQTKKDQLLEDLAASSSEEGELIDLSRDAYLYVFQYFLKQFSVFWDYFQ